MPPLDTLRPLLPVAAALALLLAAGVAALAHLALRPRDFSTPWKTVLGQLAAASPWRGRDLLFILLALSGAQLVRRMLPASTALDILAFQGVLVAAVGLQMRAKPRPFGAPAPAHAVLAQAALRWLAVLPILWFVSFAWQILLTALGHAPDFQAAIHLFLETDDPLRRASFVVFAVVVAPIAEEALFRGILLPLLVRRFGAAIGLGLVALGFAALHGDAGSFPGLAVLSVALSLAYARTGTILVPMAMHALFNAANLALILALLRSGALG